MVAVLSGHLLGVIKVGLSSPFLDRANSGFAEAVQVKDVGFCSFLEPHKRDLAFPQQIVIS